MYSNQGNNDELLDYNVACSVPDNTIENFFDDLSHCQLEGIKCVKIEQKKIIIEISNVENAGSNNLYTIEILIDENGHGKLKEYNLPPIPVDKILLLHPIYNTNNIKYFLHTCKSYIDYYLCRKKQVDDLKVIKKASLA